MLVDHIGVALAYEEFANEILFSLFGKNVSFYFLLRTIGRVAFPIYCFLISEGFYYTKTE